MAQVSHLARVELEFSGDMKDTDTIVFLIGLLSIGVVTWLGYLPRPKWVFYGYHGLMSLIAAIFLLAGLALNLVSPEQTHMVPYIQQVFSGFFYTLGGLAIISQIHPLRRLLHKWRIFPGLEPDHPAYMWGMFIFLSGLSLAILAIAFLYIPELIVEALKASPIQEIAPLNMLGFVGFALLATGIFLQPPSACFQRLGLGPLNRKQIGMAIAFILIFSLASHVSEALVMPFIDPKMQGVLKEIGTIFELKGSAIHILTIGFLIAACAGIGEEILFRGLLQPIFGILPVSILFALIHTHYGLTPLLLILFGLGLGLGYIRKKYNTTASIIVHTGFDFLALISPLLLHN